MFASSKDQRRSRLSQTKTRLIQNSLEETVRGCIGYNVIFLFFVDLDIQATVVEIFNVNMIPPLLHCFPVSQSN